DLIQIFAADKKSLRASYQHNAAIANSFARRLDPLDGKINIVKPTRCVINRVLNGQPSDTGRHTYADTFRNTLWAACITVFEIGVYRKVCRIHKLLDAGQHFI